VTMLAGAVSAYSQGAVSLNDYNGAFAIQVFQPQSAAASTFAVTYGGYTANEQVGATSDPTAVPQGSTVYANNSPLFGTVAAPAYSIQLLAAPGLSQPLNSLLPVAGTITTGWFTSSGLPGYWNAVGAASLGAIPGTTTTATVAIAAWNNEAGTVNTLAAAQTAGDPWGISPTGNIAALGFGTAQPPNLPTSVTTFSLGTTVPEPSTIALGVMGASAFLMRLRRK